MDCPPLEGGTENEIKTQNVFYFDQKKAVLATCRAFRVVIVLVLRCHCNTM
jgi:hypothetical protein